MEVQQLRVLVEVARTGSYTAAASALGYTQPAVSYQMRRLQQAVGAPVVVRVGRGLELTEIGRVLVRHADTVFSVLRAVDQDMASAVARGGGRVRIAAYQSGIVTFVPRLITRLRETHPQIRLSVVQAEPVQARQLVRDGEADLGLLCNWANEALPEGESTMLRRELITDRRCVLMREDHPLANQDVVQLHDLAEHDWVMESFRDRFEAACTTAGFEPRVVATVDDVGTIQTLVASGLGVSLMSELNLAVGLLPGLVFRPLADWPLRRTYALLWPDLAKVPAVAAVLAAMRALARDTKRPSMGGKLL